ncbi:MAG: hypothetical protein ABIA04_02395 [Pseudomonadota bacterium]
MPFKILSATTSNIIKTSIETSLFADNFSLDFSFNFEELKEQLNNQDFNLLLIDSNFDEYDNMNVLVSEVSLKNIPILVLLNKNEKEENYILPDVVKTSYIVKPFKADELETQINDLLSSSGQEEFLTPEEENIDEIRLEEEAKTDDTNTFTLEEDDLLEPAKEKDDIFAENESELFDNFSGDDDAEDEPETTGVSEKEPSFEEDDFLDEEFEAKVENDIESLGDEDTFEIPEQDQSVDEDDDWSLDEDLEKESLENSEIPMAPLEDELEENFSTNNIQVKENEHSDALDLDDLDDLFGGDIENSIPNKQIEERIDHEKLNQKIVESPNDAQSIKTMETKPSREIDFDQLDDFEDKELGEKIEEGPKEFLEQELEIQGDDISIDIIEEKSPAIGIDEELQDYSFFDVDSALKPLDPVEMRKTMEKISKSSDEKGEEKLSPKAIESKRKEMADKVTDHEIDNYIKSIINKKKIDIVSNNIEAKATSTQETEPTFDNLPISTEKAEEIFSSTCEKLVGKFLETEAPSIVENIVQKRISKILSEMINNQE